MQQTPGSYISRDFHLRKGVYTGERVRIQKLTEVAFIKLESAKVIKREDARSANGRMEVRYVLALPGEVDAMREAAYERDRLAAIKAMRARQTGTDNRIAQVCAVFKSPRESIDVEALLRILRDVTVNGVEMHDARMS